MGRSTLQLHTIPLKFDFLKSRAVDPDVEVLDFLRLDTTVFAVIFKPMGPVA